MLESQGIRREVSALYEDGSEKTASLDVDEDLDGDGFLSRDSVSEHPTWATSDTPIFGRLEGV